MVRPARCRLADHGGWGRGHTFSPRERCPLLGRVGQTWAGAGRNPCGASQSDPGRERFEHVATEHQGRREGGVGNESLGGRERITETGECRKGGTFQFYEFIPTKSLECKQRERHCHAT